MEGLLPKLKTSVGKWLCTIVASVSLHHSKNMSFHLAVDQQIMLESIIFAQNMLKVRQSWRKRKGLEYANLAWTAIRNYDIDGLAVEEM